MFCGEGLLEAPQIKILRRILDSTFACAPLSAPAACDWAGYIVCSRDRLRILLHGAQGPELG